MISTLIDFLQRDTLSISISILLFLSIFIDISKIPVNPWKWILRSISRIFNADVMKKQETLNKELRTMQMSMHDEMIQSQRLTHKELDNLQADFSKKHSDVLSDLTSIKEEQAAIKYDQKVGQKKAVRRSIIKFADECRRGENHSEERFNEILRDIDEYERLCMFTNDPNSVAEEAIKFIRDKYRGRLEKNDFLV